MLTKNYTKKEIPNDTYVVRIADTKKYIHIYGDVGLYVKPKMTGCMVFLSKETATEIVEMLKRIEEDVIGEINEDLVTEFEVVPFEEAYKAHGLVEKQVVCN